MLLLPVLRFAHEVYVLGPSEVTADKQNHSTSVFSPLHSTPNLKIFILYIVGVLILLAVLARLKSSKPLRRLGALIDRAGLWAPDLIRVVFGASLIFSAMHGALFGPELPLGTFPHPGLLKVLLYICGTALIAGIFTRLFALLALGVWVFATIQRGWYMLTYTNYLGEALALCLISCQNFSLDKLLHKLRRIKPGAGFLTKPELALPTTRILFGFSLLYAAFNIKIFHPGVSLDVVNRYHLTKFFHYDPMMIVLGAAMVEILIAVLFMVGFLQRFNTLVFIAFISLSLIYFKESVWPHYLLFALAIGIFLDRPDAWTLDRYLADKRKD